MSNELISSRKDWEVTTLGDVLKFKSGDFLNAASMDSSGSYPVYGGNGINGYHSKFMFEESKIVIGRVGAYCGSIHYTQPYSWVTDNALYIAEKDSRLSDDYLVLALRFANLNQFSSQSGQPLISASKIRDVKIVIPPLTEQRRIASLLARADRLRFVRRTAHDLGDALLQSVFLVMFGYPVTNSKKLNVEKLEGFASLVSSGSTPLVGSKVYTESGIRFIRSQNVLMNKFDFSDIAFISEEIYNSMKRTVVKPNDVLLNITGASIGRVACYRDDILANVNQHVCIIRCKPEKLNPIYLSYFLSMPSFQEKFITNQSGATRQALNFEQIKDFNISVPPLNLQEEFAGVVARVESLRGRMGESERQVEGLFESLLAQSFAN
jgi:type I restriction enzyme S subunit